MKHVVSVSLGSSKRDHVAETEMLGEKIRIERRGTNGDLRAVVNLVRQLDGKVDAFGMGGIDLYLFAGERRYVLRDARRIQEAARVTPMVDGSGLKNTLERRVIRQFENEHGPIAGKKVLMTAAVDRFGMAEALVECGCAMTFGDLIFSLGVPVPLHTLAKLHTLARVIMPPLSLMPFKLIYPTGHKQDVIRPKHRRYYDEADIIAGDFLFIRRYMPETLKGKIIITNTVTMQDLSELEQRGVRMVITTTPELGGRSFGTNVMEAALVAVSGRSPADLRPADYESLLDQLAFKPRVVTF